MNRERFLSLPYVLSAGRRTPVHSSRVGDASTAAGIAASFDLTHSFVRNVDDFVLSAVFMVLHTWYMWESPMINYTGAEFLRVLQKYISFVREHFHVDLQFVHSDCNPVYCVHFVAPLPAPQLRGASSLPRPPAYSAHLRSLASSRPGLEPY